MDPEARAPRRPQPASEAYGGWGFPTNLPSRRTLTEYLQRQEAREQDQQEQWSLFEAEMAQLQAEAKEEEGEQGEGQEDGQQQQQQQAEQQQQRQPHREQQEQQQAEQRRPILLEVLQQSRTFQSPDCAGGEGGEWLPAAGAVLPAALL